MKKLLMGFLLVLIPCLGWAQQPKDSWENLSQLRAGQKIQIVDMNLKSLKGVFVSFSDEAILLRTDGSEKAIERASVLRVSTRKESHRLRNTLIGLAAGAGVGAAIAAGMCRDDPECAEIAAATALPIGIGGGAGIGAAIPTGGWREVYRAPRREVATAR